MKHFVHIHSKRLASGDEVLLARVISETGKVGYGFSLSLEATEARHMAEQNAGVGKESGGTTLPAEIEAAVASICWLPQEETWAR